MIDPKDSKYLHQALFASQLTLHRHGITIDLYSEAPTPEEAEAATKSGNKLIRQLVIEDWWQRQQSDQGGSA